MNKYKQLLVVLCCLLFISANIFGQASSTNYKLTTGSFINGGGTQTSTSYIMSGAVISPPVGKSNSASYKLLGGIIGIAYSGAPSFIYEPVDNIPMEDRALFVEVVGGTDDVTGVFHYRYGGQASGNYDSDDMTVGTDTLFYDLSANILSVRTLEYYFEINKGASTYYLGSASEPMSFIVSFNNNQGQRPEALPDAKYRIVGVPINIAGTSTVSTVFSDDLGTYDKTKWRLGRYSTSIDSVREYPNLEAVVPGRGYWLIARGAKKYGAAGQSVVPAMHYDGTDYYPVQLEQGWNQVANPFPFEIEWEDVYFSDDGSVVWHDPNVIDEDIYWYNGSSYTTATIIPGWEGFFIYVKNNYVSILFPFKDALRVSAPASKNQQPFATSENNWQIQLILETDGLADDLNYAGVRSDASDGVDNLDRYEPPPPPEAPRLAFYTDNDSPLRRADYRAPFNDGAEWQISFGKLPDRHLAVSGIEQIPDNMEAWLILDIGQTIRLNEQNQIDLPDDVENATLIIGTEEYASKGLSENLPDEYSLSQNYPNPFNPSTTIRFALPQPGHVTLDIYNMLGQRVTTLIDEEMKAGYYTTEWNGQGDNGQQVASGVYFYRMNTGNYHENKKMLLLK